MLVYPALILALFVVAGTALAKDDTSTRKLFSSPDEATVSIGGNGLVLVRGAEVTARSTGSITAETSWDDAVLTWTVDTDGDTVYVNAHGSASSRDDIEEGDMISFSGTLEGTLRVDADTVRNWSDGNTDRTHLTGTVTSVNNGSFVVDTGNDRVTVDVESTTDITIGKDDANLDDIDVGDKVRITGSYDGDDFSASLVSVIAAKAHGDEKRSWGGIFDFFKGFKMNWNR